MMKRAILAGLLAGLLACGSGPTQPTPSPLPETGTSVPNPGNPPPQPDPPPVPPAPAPAPVPQPSGKVFVALERNTAHFMNDSATTQTVNLTVYRRGLPDTFANQVLADHASAELAAGASVTLTVTLPPCAWQIDAYLGPKVVQPPHDVSLLLAYTASEGLEICVPPTQPPSACKANPTLIITNQNDGRPHWGTTIVFVKAAWTGEPAHAKLEWGDGTADIVVNGFDTVHQYAQTAVEQKFLLILSFQQHGVKCSITTYVTVPVKTVPPTDPEPPPPQPPPPQPPPPQPPSCGEVNPARFETPVATPTHQTISWTAKVYNAGEWKLIMYATSSQSEYPNHPDYTKATHTKTLECGGSATLRVDYTWVNHSSRWWWAKLFRNGVLVYTSPMVDNNAY